VSGSIAFHCSDRRLPEKASAIYQKLMSELIKRAGLCPLEATTRSAASSRDNFDSKSAVLVARFGRDSTHRRG
jgi:hypothetical protein